MRESGRTLATISEEREGVEEAEELDSDKKEDVAENLKAWGDGPFTQEALEETEVK